MSWNYRVMRHEKINSDIEVELLESPSFVWFEVHEVYYDEKGEVKSWSVDGMAPYGETVDELIDCMKINHHRWDDFVPNFWSRLLRPVYVRPKHSN